MLYHYDCCILHESVDSCRFEAKEVEANCHEPEPEVPGVPEVEGQPGEECLRICQSYEYSYAFIS